jgi:Tol biopolymer transport system component
MIAFTSQRDGNSEIYVMNADGTDQRRLTHAAGDDYSPDWSPDGRKIAFVSERDGNDEIYGMNADGSEQRRLTSSRAHDYPPAWSPDGRKIAFASDRDGNFDIYVMDADGSHVRNLTRSSAANGARPGRPMDARSLSRATVTTSLPANWSSMS